jgi:poly(3-hydroxybutyrate) depolymerase
MRRLALLVPLLLLAACTSARPIPFPSSLPVGSAGHALRVGPLDRTFRTYRPASLPSGGKVALVLVLHGGAGTGRQAEQSYGWDAVADRDGFVLAYPDGIGRLPVKIDGPPVPDLIATWRATDSCPRPSVSTSGPVTTTTARCPSGRVVELIAVAGAGHQWPGSAAPGPVASRLLHLDPPSTALDATGTIAAFFGLE